MLKMTKFLHWGQSRSILKNLQHQKWCFSKFDLKLRFPLCFWLKSSLNYICCPLKQWLYGYLLLWLCFWAPAHGIGFENFLYNQWRLAYQNQKFCLVFASQIIQSLTKWSHLIHMYIHTYRYTYITGQLLLSWTQCSSSSSLSTVDHDGFFVHVVIINPGSHEVTHILCKNSFCTEWSRRMDDRSTGVECNSQSHWL